MIFENLENQNFSFYFQRWCSQGSHHNCAWQRCDNFNKNLNQMTLISFRYANERHDKALKGVEIFSCIIISNVKKRRKVLGSRVFYNKVKEFACYSTSHPLNARENLFLFILQFLLLWKGEIFCPSSIATLFTW